MPSGVIPWYASWRKMFYFQQLSIFMGLSDTKCKGFPPEQQPYWCTVSVLDFGQEETLVIFIFATIIIIIIF